MEVLLFVEVVPVLYVVLVLEELLLEEDFLELQLEEQEQEP